MKEIKTFKGNVEIIKENQKEWEHKLKDIEKIGGNLYIDSNAELKANNLKSIGGNLHIDSNMELKANNLKSVGGNLSIYSNAELKTNNLKSVGGNLSIYSNAELNNLKSVGGNLSIYSNAELKTNNLKSVGGNLYIDSNIELKANNLKSVGGYLYIDSNAELKLAKILWRYNSKNQWYLTEKCPEWLLQRKGKITYKIENVEFKKELFNKIRKDKLTAKEVFQLDNIEQRRIAYQKMDKSKVADLNMEVIHQSKDIFNNKMRIVKVSHEKISEGQKYLHCICPSTKREYYLGTNEDNTEKAKAKSFGLEEAEWIKEF